MSLTTPSETIGRASSGLSDQLFGPTLHRPLIIGGSDNRVGLRPKTRPNPNVRFRVLVFFYLTLYYIRVILQSQHTIQKKKSAFLRSNPRYYGPLSDNIEL